VKRTSEPSESNLVLSAEGTALMLTTFKQKNQEGEMSFRILSPCVGSITWKFTKQELKLSFRNMDSPSLGNRVGRVEFEDEFLNDTN
jgi:hypothetical protein